MGSIPTGGSEAPTPTGVGVFVCVDGPGCLVCSWAAARPLVVLRVVACGSAGVAGAVGPCRGAGLLGVLVGGGPPARRPRCELRSARRLVVRPGPAAAHGRRSLAHQSLRRPPHEWGSLTCGLERRLEARFWLPNSYSARNSRLAVSNFEFVSLELQRFREVLNNDRDKLRAKFVWRWPCRPTEARTAAWPSGSSGAFRTSGAWSAVVASPDSASRAVQNSPCLGSWW